MKMYSIPLLVTILSLSEAFYLPGLAPVNYCRSDVVEDKSKCESEVKLFVNRLNSEESVIPYDYTHFDFCTSPDISETPVENLGQVVFGERIMPSPYKMQFLEPLQCAEVCTKHYDFSNREDQLKIEKLKSAMNLNYHHHWIVDNMPVTWCYKVQGDNTYCATGFPVGCYVDAKGNRKDACVIENSYSTPDTYYIFNHIDLNITYHSGKGEDWGMGFNDNGGRIFGTGSGAKVSQDSAGRSALNHLKGGSQVLLVRIPGRKKSDSGVDSFSKVIDVYKKQGRSEHRALWDAGEYAAHTGLFPLHDHLLRSSRQETGDPLLGPSSDAIKFQLRQQSLVGRDRRSHNVLQQFTADASERDGAVIGGLAPVSLLEDRLDQGVFPDVGDLASVQGFHKQESQSGGQLLCNLPQQPARDAICGGMVVDLVMRLGLFVRNKSRMCLPSVGLSFTWRSPMSVTFSKKSLLILDGEGWDANCGACVPLPMELSSVSAGTGENKDAEKFGTPQEKHIHGVCVVCARNFTELLQTRPATTRMRNPTMFACLGFLSPANRGALMTCVLVLYVCLGFPAGYTSARLYKSFGGEKWKSNVLLTSMLCPGFVFGIFFFLNLILAYKGSSAAVPFSTLIALLALWFLVSVPLTFVGAFFGFRKRTLENPVRTNKIPRQIPDQSIYTKPLPGSVMGGVLPFGCIFIQLFFILNSIWSNQTYYMFGFLFLVFLILCITCSETTILLCYFHLCAEDYHWWWRSYLTSGFTAFYLFIYCVHYFATKLNISGFVSTLLYFGYTIIMVFLFFLLTGTIGFCACFWFVRKIYSVVKVD
ncbi:transmembrane 9 superfamily member 2 [Hyalella azteca]|uniref:Transmembrane 9 superfamily member n=1 Tax=Hyalella azteca TaxID=294128 RepID=A0A8B7PNS3_HYAAZ|nr:transmembrane 9 superfamily member 2 [Hyalella azteca]